MRLWSLHPKYLDPQGLVALWREALLAKAVLLGETRGYRHHPQLARFRNHAAPVSAIAEYLAEVHREATNRSYSFDRSKLLRRRKVAAIPVATGQLEYEWNHLLSKLRIRNASVHKRLRTIDVPECHPLFRRYAGGIESWERHSRP